MNLLHRIKLDKLLNVRGRPILTSGPLISIFKVSWLNAETSLELSTVSIRIPIAMLALADSISVEVHLGEGEIVVDQEHTSSKTLASSSLFIWLSCRLNFRRRSFRGPSASGRGIIEIETLLSASRAQVI